MVPARPAYEPILSSNYIPGTCIAQAVLALRPLVLCPFQTTLSDRVRVQVQTSRKPFRKSCLHPTAHSRRFRSAWLSSREQRIQRVMLMMNMNGAFTTAPQSWMTTRRPRPQIPMAYPPTNTHRRILLLTAPETDYQRPS